MAYFDGCMGHYFGGLQITEAKNAFIEPCMAENATKGSCPPTNVYAWFGRQILGQHLSYIHIPFNRISLTKRSQDQLRHMNNSARNNQAANPSELEAKNSLAQIGSGACIRTLARTITHPSLAKPGRGPIAMKQWLMKNLIPLKVWPSDFLVSSADPSPSSSL